MEVQRRGEELGGEVFSGERGRRTEVRKRQSVRMDAEFVKAESEWEMLPGSLGRLWSLPTQV